MFNSHTSIGILVVNRLQNELIVYVLGQNGNLTSMTCEGAYLIEVGNNIVLFVDVLWGTLCL